MPDSYTEKMRQMAKAVLKLTGTESLPSKAKEGVNQANKTVNGAVDKTLNYLKSGVTSQPASPIQSGYSAQTPALSSIPGLRPASLNGETVSETHLRAARLANQAGLALKPTFGPAAEKLGQRVESIKQSRPSTSMFSDPSNHSIPNPAPLQRQIDADRARLGVQPPVSVQQANQEAIDAARKAQQMIEIAKLRERLRQGN